METAIARTARCGVVTADIAARSPLQVLNPNEACFWCIGQVASLLQQAGPAGVALRPHDGTVPRIAPLVRSKQSTATRRRCVSKRRHCNVDGVLLRVSAPPRDQKSESPSDCCAASMSRNRLRDISRAPSAAMCGVVTWQSIHVAPRWRRCSMRKSSASLEASGAR